MMLNNFLFIPLPSFHWIQAAFNLQCCKMQKFKEILEEDLFYSSRQSPFLSLELSLLQNTLSCLALSSWNVVFQMSCFLVVR